MGTKKILFFCFYLHDCTQVCVCVSTDIHYECPHKDSNTSTFDLVGTFIVNISTHTDTHLSTIMQTETERQTQTQSPAEIVSVTRTYQENLL